MVLKITRLNYNPQVGLNLKYSKEFDKDIPRLHQYLKSKYSEKNQKYVRNRLIHFNEWMKGEFEVPNLLTVTLPMVETFFNDVIDIRSIKIVTKNKWRTQLEGYYKYVKTLKEKMSDKVFHDIFKIRKEDFFNPIPGILIYRFSKETVTLAEIKEKSTKLINYDIAITLLNYFYYNWFEMFVIVGLCSWTGARIAEIVSIKINDLDLQNHFFFNILKRTTKEDTYGVYFFPPWFIKYLQIQIEQKNLIYPDEPFLFPSTRIIEQHISQHRVRQRIHEACKLLNIEATVTPHKFRALLNTHRKRMGVEPEDRSILLNHGLNSTQAKHYILDYHDFNELKKIFDNNFPYPEFKPDPDYLEKKD